MRTIITLLLAATMLFPAVTSVEGNARRLSQGSESALSIGASINDGDTIITGAGASVEFETDFGVFRVSERSRFTVNSVQDAKANIRTTIDLGKVFFAFSKLTSGREAIIATPTAVAAVRGTSFVIEAGSEAMDIAVLTGEVDVNNEGGGRIRLRAMESVRALRKGALDALPVLRERMNDLERLSSIRGIERIKDVAEMRQNIARVRERIAKEDRDAADNDRRGRELFNKLTGEGLIDSDDASIRTELREMLANGGNPTHIASMLRMSKDAGIRGDELRETLARANTAMLMGVSIRDVNRSLSHSIRETGKGPITRERLRELSGRFDGTLRQMVTRADGSRLRDRIRTLAGRREALRRYGSRIHDWLAAHPEAAASLQNLLTYLRNR